MGDTPRMAIVPVEATIEQIKAAHEAMFEEPFIGDTAVMIGAGLDSASAASPNAGKVSLKQLEEAFIAIAGDRSLPPSINDAKYQSFLAGLRALGLEIVEE